MFEWDANKAAATLDAKHLDIVAIVRDELELVDRMWRDKYTAVLRDLAHVTLLEGRARFTGPNTLDVDGRTLTSDRFIIATGSTATVPPVPGLREAGFLTHIEALRLEHLPESIVVIGAGPLGLEFSQLFARCGTRVTILQRSATVFPRTEPILSERLTELFKREGIDVLTKARVKAVTRYGDHKQVMFDTSARSRAARRRDQTLRVEVPPPSGFSAAMESARREDEGASALKIWIAFAIARAQASSSSCALLVVVVQR